jgi:hypothetical protein
LRELDVLLPVVEAEDYLRNKWDSLSPEGVMHYATIARGEATAARLAAKRFNEVRIQRGE